MVVQRGNTSGHISYVYSPSCLVPSLTVFLFILIGPSYLRMIDTRNSLWNQKTKPANT